MNVRVCSSRIFVFHGIFSVLVLPVSYVVLCRSLVISYIGYFTTPEVLLHTLFYLNLMIGYIDR